MIGFRYEPRVYAVNRVAHKMARGERRARCQQCGRRRTAMEPKRNRVDFGVDALLLGEESVLDIRATHTRFSFQGQARRKQSY